jgi:hypothetical protein
MPGFLPERLQNQLHRGQSELRQQRTKDFSRPRWENQPSRSEIKRFFVRHKVPVARRNGKMMLAHTDVQEGFLTPVAKGNRTRFNT